jgi:hypothetical protein
MSLIKTAISKGNLLTSINMSFIEMPIQITKKLSPKIYNTELLDSLMSILKPRQKRHSRTYSQIHKDKIALALANQLNGTLLS